MTDYPIPLSPSQVKGARAGTRTHICLGAFIRGSTRYSVVKGESPHGSPTPLPSHWLKVVPGDVLWVQEDMAVAYNHRHPERSIYVFTADALGGRAPIPGGHKRGEWRHQSIAAAHMAREDSRYTLLVKSVRSFNVQAIAYEEVKAEGTLPNVDHLRERSPGVARRNWWDANYGLIFPWDKNPAIVGVTFEFRPVNLLGVPAAPPKWGGESERGKAFNAYLDEKYPRPAPVEQPKAEGDGEA